MEAVTKVRKQLTNLSSGAGLEAGVAAMVEASAIFFLAMRHDLWPLAVLVVLAVEIGLIRPGRPQSRKDWLILLMPRVSLLIAGVSSAIIVAIVPRVATQIVVALMYAGWRLWWGTRDEEAEKSLPALLVTQAVMFEAIFLMAAVWRTSNTASWMEELVLVLVWLGSFGSVYSVLSSRGEKVAGVMAATWAVVCVEISWVLVRWLFVYTLSGGYLLVPQPVVILTALAYCFGSIYALQRKGHLSRGRLTEYLLIGMILIAIVITGTPWRGSL